MARLMMGIREGASVMASNSRRTERYDLAIPATIELPSDHNEDAVISWNLTTSNVSAGGAYFETEQPLPVGAKVKMEMELSIEKLMELYGKKAQIRLQGEVVRTETRGMAICFDPKYEITSVCAL